MDEIHRKLPLGQIGRKAVETGEYGLTYGLTVAESTFRFDFSHLKNKNKNQAQAQRIRDKTMNVILTKVLIEEGQGGQVAAQAEELGHHHEPVPGTNRQCHHQQLSQDEGCERDGDHVHKLRLEQHQCAVHQDASWWHQSKQTDIIQRGCDLETATLTVVFLIPLLSICSI